jgi:hypothetical protein
MFYVQVVLFESCVGTLSQVLLQGLVLVIKLHHVWRLYGRQISSILSRKHYISISFCECTRSRREKTTSLPLDKQRIVLRDKRIRIFACVGERSSSKRK